MKFFEITFNKTGEYGDMYEETCTDILMADTIDDIISYLIDTYMPDATQETGEEIIILSRDVEGYPSYYIHEILIHEVNISPLTPKIMHLS